MPAQLKLFNPNSTSQVDGYAEMNARWIAGLKRLLQAVKKGREDEDPVILFPDLKGKKYSIK